MNGWTAEDLRATTLGRWRQRPDRIVPINGVGIDSRDDLAGKAFVAVRGERHDGHTFLTEAAGAGAKLMIIEDGYTLPNLPEDIAVFAVPDTRRALGQLAKAHRKALAGTKFIAITGSVGKTTTKRLIHTVLATTHNGREAPRSYNNEIGVPLTILAAKPSDRYVVVEAGMSAPGEIAHLGAIIEPDIAIITAVGRAHLEGVGSLQAIAEEKASLLRFVRPGGTVIVNIDAPHLDAYVRRNENVITFGESDSADLRLTARGAHEQPSEGQPKWWFEINNRQRFDLRLPGRHNALNALAAVATARRMGVTDERINDGLSQAEPVAMRMQTHRIGPLTIYNDAYNANPEAMAASLETFGETSAHAERRVVILGEMLELGADAPAMHREVGRQLIDLDSQMRIDRAVFVGEAAKHIASTVSKIWRDDRYLHVAAVHPDIVTFLGDLFNDTRETAVLLKGSRRVGLEQLINWLARAIERTPNSDQQAAGTTFTTRQSITAEA